MPSIFVSHGAPPTLDDPQWLEDLCQWARSMPKPRAIVVVSARWENAPVTITGSGAGTPMHYDFGGFHPRNYTLKYDTPDATDLAHRIAGALGGTTPIHQYVDRGLDHGAFIPLMAMYRWYKCRCPASSPRRSWPWASACARCATRASWSSDPGS